MRSDFSNQFRPVLESAYAVAREFGSPAIGSEHFILAALRDTDSYACKILRQLSVPVDRMKSDIEEYLRQNNPMGDTTTLFEQQYKISVSAVRHLQLAVTEARKMNVSVIGGMHIILALMHDSKSMDSPFLEEFKKNYLNFDISIQNVQDSQMPKTDALQSDDEDEEESFRRPSSGMASGKDGKPSSDTPALDKFGYDMTRAAAEGRLDPVVGREK